WRLRVLGPRPVEPRAEVGERAVVPAEVLVEGEDVGVPVLRIRGGVVGGVRREARGILPAHDRSELRDDGIRRVPARLVADAPEADRGMVVVLADELAKLLLRVLEEFRGGKG